MTGINSVLEYYYITPSLFASNCFDLFIKKITTYNVKMVVNKQHHKFYGVFGSTNLKLVNF